MSKAFDEKVENNREKYPLIYKMFNSYQWGYHGNSPYINALENQKIEKSN